MLLKIIINSCIKINDSKNPIVNSISLKIKMLPEEIIKFGRELTNYVRDSAIKSCDSRLRSNNVKSPSAKRWQDAKSRGNIDEFGEMIIPDCVDEAIFYLLEAIDLGVLNISLNTSEGKAINLTEQGKGELSGWYSGQWISEYSKERFIDDFPEP